jgi:NitT/TauT family transport system substrate-binding protein
MEIFMIKFLVFFLLLINSVAFSADTKPLKLALNWKAEPQFGGFYAAEKHDIFKKNNLNVKILEGGSGTPTLQMLAAGQVEYAIVSADELILAYDRGIKDIVALFAAYQINPQGLMVRQDFPAKDISELFNNEKATLLWQSGLPYAQFIKKKYPNMKVKTAPYLGGIGSLQNNPKIIQQCFVTSEPLLAKKAKLNVKSFRIADAGYNPYTTVLVTKKARLDKNKDEVLSIVKSVRLGWETYLKDPGLTHQLILSLNKSMNTETLTDSAEAQKELIVSKKLGEMTTERWQTLIEQLKDLGLIKITPEAKDLFFNL